MKDSGAYTAHRLWGCANQPHGPASSSHSPRDPNQYLLFSDVIAPSVKVKVAQLCPTLQPHGLYSPWDSPGQNIGVGSLSLLQGIVPTQGLKPGLLCCSQILYQLSHKGSPKILQWVAHPFSSRSSQPRNRIRVSCIAGRFFSN